MPFKTLFAAFNTKPRVQRPKMNIAVQVKEIKVFDAEGKARVQDDVHVRLIFDEEGNVVIREVEHFKAIEVPSPTLSSTTTLVGTPHTSQPTSPTIEDQKTSAAAAKQEAVIAPLDPLAFSRTADLLDAFKADVYDPHPVQRKINTSALRVISVLGTGGQGTVYKVQDRETTEVFALKAILKHTVATTKYLTIFNEQDLLKRMAGNPRFLSLRASFEDNEFFYLLTDYYHAGDLHGMIYDYGRLSEELARLYCAQIIVAMEALHGQRIIHRDLKPENILLNGHKEVVIADFGLARAFGRTVEQQPWRCDKRWELREDKAGGFDGLGLDQTDRMCGTPKYIPPELWVEDDAPEVFYSYGIDIWAFGVTLYEMLHAEMPFGLTECVDRTDVEARIKHADLMVGDHLSEDAADLLYTILDRDPRERPTWEEIREHSWFSGFDWTTIEHRIASPTTTASPSDLQTFEARMVTFEEPYAEGEAPYPFFEWVAPDLADDLPDSSSDAYLASSEWMPSSASLEAMGWPISSPDHVFALCPPLQSFSALRQVDTGHLGSSALVTSQECLAVYASDHTLSPSDSASSFGSRSLVDVPSMWLRADELPRRPSTTSSTVRYDDVLNHIDTCVASALDAFGIAAMDMASSNEVADTIVDEPDFPMDASEPHSTSSFSTSISISSMYAIAMAGLPKAFEMNIEDRRQSQSFSIDAADMEVFVFGDTDSARWSSSDGSYSSSGRTESDSSGTPTSMSADSRSSTFSGISLSSSLNTVSTIPSAAPSAGSDSGCPTSTKSGWQHLVGSIKSWWSCLGLKAARPVSLQKAQRMDMLS